MTKHLKILLLAGACAAPFAVQAHCGSCGVGDAKASAHHQHAKTGDVIAVASGNGSFNTLVAAVKAAGLVETLQGEGPFTIFAPTDAAFAALPAGTVESLLKPENRAQLVAILTYHVVPAKVLAADVKAGAAPTVNGKQLQVSVSGGTVKVNEATVVQTDVMASNGVIHVIDAVMLPPTTAGLALN